MGQGVTRQENQSRYVQCGKQSTDHVPLNRCGACKINRYYSKECQVKYRTVHKPVCMAIQELEKQKAAGDDGDDLNTTFPCHLTPRQQLGLTKIVGRRCVVKCLIQGKEVEALWDTGSQVCVVSRKWQQTHLPLEVLRNVEELLGAGEELNLEAMNGTNIPFDGWIEVGFKLAGDDTTAHELTVPVLVGQKEQEYPIIGFNVIEEVLAQHGGNHQAASNIIQQSFPSIHHTSKNNLSYSPIVQSAVHKRNATLYVKISPPSTAIDHNQLALDESTKRANYFVLHNPRQFFVDDKPLRSSPGRVANVTHSNHQIN